MPLTYGRNVHEAATGARTLTNAEGLAANRQFNIAARSFADANPMAGESGAPVYSLVSREGPDHAPRFVVEAPFSTPTASSCAQPRSKGN